jgi:hypothetical protein
MDRRRTIGIWLLRSVVFVAVGLVTYAFINPWWVCSFMDGHFIKIYGWGLTHNLESLAIAVKNDITPQWQVILAWVYVGVSCLLALWSTWMKRFAGALLLGFSGIGFVAYPMIAIYMVISNRIMGFGISLQGFSTVQGTIHVHSYLTHWHYLSIAGGIILVISAVIRSILKQPPVSLSE